MQGCLGKPTGGLIFRCEILEYGAKFQAYSTIPQRKAHFERENGFGFSKSNISRHLWCRNKIIPFNVVMVSDQWVENQRWLKLLHCRMNFWSGCAAQWQCTTKESENLALLLSFVCGMIAFVLFCWLWKMSISMSLLIFSQRSDQTNGQWIWKRHFNIEEITWKFRFQKFTHFFSREFFNLQN